MAEPKVTPPTRRAVSFGAIRERANAKAGIGGNYADANQRHLWAQDRTPLYLFGAKREERSSFGDRVVFAVHPDIDAARENWYLVPMSLTTAAGNFNAGRLELANEIASATRRGEAIGPVYMQLVPTRSGQEAWDFADDPDANVQDTIPF